MGLGVGQARDDVEELDDRAGPAVRRGAAGTASSCAERAWTKWIDWSSMRVRKCSNSLSRASCARQSYVSRQYSTSSRQVVERDPVLPAGAVDLVGDAGLGQTAAQILEDGVVDADLEALDHGDHGRTTGSVSQPRTVDVGASRALSRSTSHSGNRLQDLVERHAPLEARERGAQAEVDAAAEGQVLTDVAVDVEAVAVGVAPVVAVGRADQEHHDAALAAPSGRSARRRGRRSARRAAPAARSGGAPRSRSGSATDPRRARGAGRDGRASTLPAQPMSRVVVSLPAPATTLTYVSTSSRVRRRVVPVSSSNSALSSSVMRSSEGCSARQST